MRRRAIVAGAVLSASICLALGGCGKNSSNGTGMNTEVAQKENATLDRENLDLDHLSGDDLAELCTTYSIDYDMSEYRNSIFDSAGKQISDWGMQFSVLKDTVTDEELYYVAHYKEYEEIDADKCLYHIFSRLYDMNGKVLVDWKEAEYDAAFGDWLLELKRPGDFVEDYFEALDCKLVNIKTNEEIPDILSIYKLGNHIYASSIEEKNDGILDENGEKLAGFPLEADGEYRSVEQDLYFYSTISESNQATFKFYDEDYHYLGQVVDKEDMYVDTQNILAPYINCSGSIYNPSTGDGGDLQPVFESKAVTYFDGEIAVARSKTEDTDYYALYDVKTNEKLSGDYTQLEFATGYYDFNLSEKVSCFYGVNGTKIEKIGRDGKVLASAEVEAESCNVSVHHAGVIVYTDDFSHTSLYDVDLNQVVPADKYADFSVVIDNADHPEKSFWKAGYQLCEGAYRVDLLRADGTVLLSGNSECTYNGDEYIGISRGKNIGVIDLDGNWKFKLDKISLIPVSDSAKPGEESTEIKIPIEGIDAEHAPRLDGSLANEPMIYRILKDTTGMNQDAAEVFLADSFRDGGTSTCWSRIAWDEADLAISYEMPDSTKEYMEEYLDKMDIDPLGRDGLVFIVNKDNPIESLTVQQIHDIYTGKITDWSEVGGEPGKIKAFQRNSSSGSQTLLNKLVMNGDATVEPEQDALIGTMGELIKQVAEFDGSGGALGFSVFYYADRMKSDPNLKMIKIEGVAPSNETIEDGSYPLANDFYLVMLNTQPKNSPIRRLRDWLLSEEGKKLIIEEGYVPVK